MTLQLLDPQNPISSSDSVQQLLETHRSFFLKLTPKIHQGKPRVKLLTHRNAEQKEVIDHIVFLQKALDKPLHLDKLSLETKDRSVAPPPQVVETLLSRKKQFLEDTTNKQILRNR